ncbi:hypothetical protein D6779_00350 [Candidatus Parcubacteria bacterium]|nr:MAG: hypothetical protein D6779_00350 [Candidatus Parcubacteria bacterium]
MPALSTATTNALILIVSIVSWLPKQEPAYALPFILALFWLILLSMRKKQIQISRNILFSLLGIILFIFICVFHSLVRYGALSIHMILWALTHGSLLVALVFVLLSKSHVFRSLYFLINVNIFLGCFEVALGWWQFVTGPSFNESSAAGDHVIGTLGDNSHLFAMKMLSLAIISIFTWEFRKQKRYLVCAIMFISAWILASALHTVLVLIFAGAIYFLIGEYSFLKKIKVLIFSFLLLLGIIIMLYFVQERNIYYMLAKFSFENPAKIGQLFGKIEFMKRTLIDLPLQEGVDAALVGVGPGTYSSRASWILSGEYLRNQSYVPIIPTYVWAKYLRDIWSHDLLESTRWSHGVANQPFSTWFTILGEFGYIGLLFVLFALIRLIIYFKRPSISSLNVSIANMSVFIILFLTASFFFDNWLEYPRLMLPIVCLLAISAKCIQLLSLRKPHCCSVKDMGEKEKRSEFPKGCGKFV